MMSKCLYFIFCIGKVTIAEEVQALTQVIDELPFARAPVEASVFPTIKSL